MSDIGEKALGGEFEKISVKCFEMKKNMLMTFKGHSCNITDEEGKFVGAYGPINEEVKREVMAGYKCFVMRALIKFETTES